MSSGWTRTVQVFGLLSNRAVVDDNLVLEEVDTHDIPVRAVRDVEPLASGQQRGRRRATPV